MERLNRVFDKLETIVDEKLKLNLEIDGLVSKRATLSNDVFENYKKIATINSELEVLEGIGLQMVSQKDKRERMKVEKLVNSEKVIYFEVFEALRTSLEFEKVSSYLKSFNGDLSVKAFTDKFGVATFKKYEKFVELSKKGKFTGMELTEEVNELLENVAKADSFLYQSMMRDARANTPKFKEKVEHKASHNIQVVK